MMIPMFLCQQKLWLSLETSSSYLVLLESMYHNCAIFWDLLQSQMSPLLSPMGPSLQSWPSSKAMLMCSMDLPSSDTNGWHQVCSPSTIKKLWIAGSKRFDFSDSSTFSCSSLQNFTKSPILHWNPFVAQLQQTQAMLIAQQAHLCWAINSPLEEQC